MRLFIHGGIALEQQSMAILCSVRSICTGFLDAIHCKIRFEDLEVSHIGTEIVISHFIANAMKC